MLGMKKLGVAGIELRTQVWNRKFYFLGRLQKILHVDLPSPSDRVSILTALTKRRPLLGPDVDFEKLAHDQVSNFSC